jgi:hypothetical protein
VPRADFPGVDSVIDDIAKCELRYRDFIETALTAEDLAQREQELLDVLDSYLPSLVHAFDSQVPPPRERGGNLALEKEYYEWRGTSGDADARRRGVIRSFLATETERRAQFRLSRSQNGRMAAHFDAIGEEFLTLDMPGHAALAYQSAADLYLPLHQRSHCERSLLNRRRAQHRARPPGLPRVIESVFDALCGYGYRPLRLLAWMTLTLAVFSVAVWLCGPAGYGRSLQGCLIDYLNPLAFGDFGTHFGSSAQVLLVIESYFGSISMSVFFALLIRRAA